MSPERWVGSTLVFDGDCRVCSAFARLITWWGSSRDLRVLPFQLPETRDLLLGLTDEQVRGSAHLVLEDGRVLSGLRAFPALLDRLPAIGSVHQRIGHRSASQRLVRALYDAGVALRRSTRCAASHAAPTA